MEWEWRILAIVNSDETVNEGRAMGMTRRG